MFTLLGVDYSYSYCFSSMQLAYFWRLDGSFRYLSHYCSSKNKSLNRSYSSLLCNFLYFPLILSFLDHNIFYRFVVKVLEKFISHIKRLYSANTESKEKELKVGLYCILFSCSLFIANLTSTALNCKVEWLLNFILQAEHGVLIWPSLIY